MKGQATLPYTITATNVNDPTIKCVEEGSLLIDGWWDVKTKFIVYGKCIITEVFQPSKNVNMTPWVYTKFFIIQL